MEAVRTTNTDINNVAIVCWTTHDHSKIRKFGFHRIFRAGLMRAADDTIHVSGNRSNTRMPPLLERKPRNGIWCIAFGCTRVYYMYFWYPSNCYCTTKKIQKWLHIIIYHYVLGSRSHIANRELGAPLLNSTASRQPQSLPSAHSHLHLHPHLHPLLRIIRLLSNDSFQKATCQFSSSRASQRNSVVP